MPASSSTSTVAPSTSAPPPQSAIPTKPIVSHVNMQLDCFIANCNPDDLRAIVRTILATGPIGSTSCFTKAARNRMIKYGARNAHSPSSYWTPSTDASKPRHGTPSQRLWESVRRARSYFGAGLGFESIPILITFVDSVTDDLEWDMYSETEEALFTIDGDIAQAIQSCREQVAGKEVPDLDKARATLGDLRAALERNQATVEAWGGEFPFEKAVMSLDGWKL